jgi:putative FmdB family regulatory protein
MPIFEFKCDQCNHFFELLVIHRDDDPSEIRCPRCGSETFERVMSATNYAMAAGSAGTGAKTQTRTCSGGSCTTYEVPGVA